MPKLRRMRNLVLVGFMGSGKTAAGQRAADRLGLGFIDMDRLIEHRHQRTISDMFAHEGEARFRKLERQLVRELTAQQGKVIATGGGVVLDPENIRDFSRAGVVVCCWVDARTAHERTRHANHRPLLEAEPDRLAQIEKLLRQREPLYRAIPLQLDTSFLSVEQQADELVRIYRENS